MKKTLTFILLIASSYIVVSQELISYVPGDDFIVTEKQLQPSETVQSFNVEIQNAGKNTNTDENFICGESSITYEGKVYHTIFYNERCWLDRNLEANEAAKSFDDPESYGGYFQWGRQMDGHEHPDYMPTILLSAIDNPGLSNFFIVTEEPFDWRSPKKDKLWSKTGGINNPCPEGWRLPTIEEWENTSSGWNSLEDAFNSPLKISASGCRRCSDGMMTKNDGACSIVLWSCTTNENQAYSISIGATEPIIEKNNRAMGIPVRCIKAEN